ncbi:hypothetical protein MYX07_00340 [Patescibacteria group bacterium AH-259-L07]|nr:hypothetical protein [Patescibacteria group bacterium AH-259-L07]
MPYLTPVKKKKGWVLPKVGGNFHRSKKGKIIHFKSKAGAKRAAGYIGGIEHGFKPIRKMAKKRKAKKRTTKRSSKRRRRVKKIGVY